MHDTVRRALRTFAQALLASLLIVIPTAMPDGWTGDDWWTLLVGALYSAGVALITFLHNELEDAGRIRDTRGPQ